MEKLGILNLKTVFWIRTPSCQNICSSMLTCSTRDWSVTWIALISRLHFKWISRFNIITTSNTKHWENFKYNAICFIMKMYYFVALKYMIYLPLNQLQHLHLNYLATIKEHQVKTIRYCEYWGLMSRRQKILKISETRFPL